jgi:hypothetical protein
MPKTKPQKKSKALSEETVRARATAYVDTLAKLPSDPPPTAAAPMEELRSRKEAVRKLVAESKHPFEFLALFVSGLPLPRRTPDSILRSLVEALDRLETPPPSE